MTPLPRLRAFARAAYSRWFLDRSVEFWLNELSTRWSLTELRAVVAEVIDETADAKTFVLVTNRAWPGHRAGQYVPVDLEIDGVRTRRCYSISSGGSQAGVQRIAITVKRVPGGRVSNWLHDHLGIGAMVRLGAPAGDFVVEHGAVDARVAADADCADGIAGRAKLLLVGGGSGITPIAAIVRDLVARGTHASRNADAVDPSVAEDVDRELRGVVSLANASAPADELATSSACRGVASTHRRAMAAAIVVIHAARTDDDAIFGDELAHLGATVPGLRVIAHRGPLDAAALRTYAPDHAEREVYACGPQGLMDVVTSVAGSRVHLERFVAAPVARPVASNEQRVVRLAMVERVHTVGEGTLLEELERAGERPAHGCRMGICNSCRCTKRSGTVEDLVTGATSSEPDQEIRLCVSIARSDLDLAL